MNQGEYLIRKVANGWVLQNGSSPGAEPDEYIFETVADLANWLAERHGEPHSRRLIQDWN